MVKNPNCLEAKKLAILQDSVAEELNSDYWEQGGLWKISSAP